MNCTRCGWTGFLNIEQVPDEFIGDWEKTLRYIKESTVEHDVQVCDCCGDGHGWHGEAGRHYTSSDPSGPHGPYAYNGGVAECH